MKHTFKTLLKTTASIAVGMASVGVNTMNALGQRLKDNGELPDVPVEKRTGSMRRAHNAARHAGRGEFGSHFIATKDNGGRKMRQVGVKAIRNKEGEFSRWGLLMQAYVTTSKLHATKGWRHKTFFGPVGVR